MRPTRAQAMGAGQHLLSGFARARAWLKKWRWWQWLLAMPAAGLAYVLLLVPLTPGISDIHKAKVEQPTQLLTQDGQALALFKRSHREWVPLEQVAPAVVDALIATEDHRFYDHFGMDWRRTAASVVHSLRGDLQGGSTLTQQLARNLYPEEIGRAASLNRKLKEAVTAFKIEALYSKREILETYLNTVPFLYNAWGIEMAARTYFSKSAAQLTVLEAATLVGMLKGTSYYNPVRNPERAKARRNTVLSQMHKRGVLPQAQLEKLQAQPLRLRFARQEPPTGMAPHFAQQVRQWLVHWADEAGYNIYADGLVVHTTLDGRWQQWATQAVRSHTRTLQGVADTNWRKASGWRAESALERQLVRESSAFAALREKGVGAEQAQQTLLDDADFMQQLHRSKTRIEAGMVVLDPETAQVRAWVGGRDYTEDAFDHVQQARRQPGSTFKPFVYGAALQNGVKVDDTRKDEAVAIALEGGEVWRPSDASAPTGKDMRLRQALAQSKNTIAAALVQEVGADAVARLARDLGVRNSPLLPVPALALGASPVTLLEMTNAYGSLARGGVYRAPRLVTRIEDKDGKVLAEFAPDAGSRAMDAHDSYALLDMMRAVVAEGTARDIRRRWGIQADVAGKTGTTQGNADGWFILMHPHMVVGSWVGFNDARITLRSDYWGQGARSALPIVGDFTSRALRAKAIDRHAVFVQPQRWQPWATWSESVHNWWQAWWARSGDDAEAAGDGPQGAAPRKAKTPVNPAAADAPLPVESAQVPQPPAVQPQPQAVPQPAAEQRDGQLLPAPSDALDEWLQQWQSHDAPQAATAPTESTVPVPAPQPDWERQPPAVRGQLPESEGR